jgi:hypothetical protein
VSGVELLDGVPRALLLLDPRWPQPWAVGHNARLELTRDARGLRYRSLDGQKPMELAVARGFMLGLHRGPG